VPDIPVDYLEKYRPMLHLLEDYNDDLEYLSSHPGYAKTHGTRFRGAMIDVLQGYVDELTADFETLSSMAGARALQNPELASRLLRTRKLFNSCIRYIRFRMLVDQFLPTPAARSRLAFVRRVLLGLLPRQATPYQLLAYMNTLRFIITAQ
jgi:hypothetical protein